MLPDYYAVLGVGRRASAQQIQRAYRRGVLRTHPDRNPAGPGGENSPDIRLINEAWDVLGDAVRRAAYDEQTELQAEKSESWPAHSTNIPALPPGFEFHPRLGAGVADYAAWVSETGFVEARARDAAYGALSLYAETADLSGLSELGDGELRLLDARWLAVTDSELRGLGRFRQLTVLLLEETRVTDAGLQFLLPLPALERLSLTACPITDRGLPALAAHRSLRRLEINETRVTDEGLAALEAHPALNSLDIRGTKVKGEGIRHLAELPHLTELLVGGRAARVAAQIFSERPEVTVF